MSYHNGPKIVTDGLVMYADAGNSKSYKGQVTTNLCLVTVTSGFSTDYPAAISQSTDSLFSYNGRSSKKVVATGTWNLYLNGAANYTQTSSGVFVFSWKMKRSDGAAPVIGNGYIYTPAVSTYPAVTVTAIDNGWYQCTCTYNTTSSTLSLTGFTTSQTGVFYITDWQIEARLAFSQYVFGSRGTTVATGGGLYDLSGNSNHGTVVNDPAYNLSNGGNLVFDGVDDYIDISNALPSAFSSSQAVSIFTYAKISSVVSKNTLISFNGERSFFLPGNRLTATYQLYWDSTGWKNGTNSSWSVGQWYYLGWTISGTTLTFYVNGIANGTAAVSAFTPTASTAVRFGFANAGEYATGSIALMSIHNKALNAAEVLQNFNATRGRFGL